MEFLNTLIYVGLFITFGLPVLLLLVGIIVTTILVIVNKIIGYQND